MEILPRNTIIVGVRDTDATEGWIHQSLLSGERTASVAPWKRGKDGAYVDLRNEPQKNSQLVAKLEPGVVVRLDECNGNWCRAEIKDVEGWISQEDLWGAYPGEAFK